MVVASSRARVAYTAEDICACELLYAIKIHKKEGDENVELLRAGCANLAKHIANAKSTDYQFLPSTRCDLTLRPNTK